MGTRMSLPLANRTRAVSGALVTIGGFALGLLPGLDLINRRISGVPLGTATGEFTTGETEVGGTGRVTGTTGFGAGVLGLTGVCGAVTAGVRATGKGGRTSSLGSRVGS